MSAPSLAQRAVACVIAASASFGIGTFAGQWPSIAISFLLVLASVTFALLATTTALIARRRNMK